MVNFAHQANIVTWQYDHFCTRHMYNTCTIWQRLHSRIQCCASVRWATLSDRTQTIDFTKSHSVLQFVEELSQIVLGQSASQSRFSSLRNCLRSFSDTRLHKAAFSASVHCVTLSDRTQTMGFTKSHSMLQFTEELSQILLRQSASQSRIQCFSSLRNSPRSYSVSYCFSSHSSSRPSITVCAFCRVVVEASVLAIDAAILSSLTENRSSSWSVAIEDRLALSALITELAMFILNFWRLQTKQKSESKWERSLELIMIYWHSQT